MASEDEANAAAAAVVCGGGRGKELAAEGSTTSPSRGTRIPTSIARRLRSSTLPGIGWHALRTVIFHLFLSRPSYRYLILRELLCAKVILAYENVCGDPKS
jgi:hypothetical protein